MASMKRKHLCYDDKRFFSATVEERLQNLLQLGALLEVGMSLDLVNVDLGNLPNYTNMIGNRGWKTC